MADCRHEREYMMGTIRSQVMRDAAKGVECMLNIAGVCNGDPTTTCMVHLPDETKGGSTKSDDTSSTAGCSACHDVIDGRVKSALTEEDLLFYMFRGLKRWNKYLIEKGIITIKGMKRK